jgi:hypothetical protein
MKIRISHLARPLCLARADEPRAVRFGWKEGRFSSQTAISRSETILCYEAIFAYWLTKFGLLGAVRSLFIHLCGMRDVAARKV